MDEGLIKFLFSLLVTSEGELLVPIVDRRMLLYSRTVQPLSWDSMGYQELWVVGTLSSLQTHHVIESLVDTLWLAVDYSPAVVDRVNNPVSIPVLYLNVLKHSVSLQYTDHISVLWMMAECCRHFLFISFLKFIGQQFVSKLLLNKPVSKKCMANI